MFTSQNAEDRKTRQDFDFRLNRAFDFEAFTSWRIFNESFHKVLRAADLTEASTQASNLRHEAPCDRFQYNSITPPE